jgi:hypothetical protein
VDCPEAIAHDAALAFRACIVNPHVRPVLNALIVLCVSEITSFFQSCTSIDTLIKVRLQVPLCSKDLGVGWLGFQELPPRATAERRRGARRRDVASDRE